MALCLRLSFSRTHTIYANVLQQIKTNKRFKCAVTTSLKSECTFKMFLFDSLNWLLLFSSNLFFTKATKDFSDGHLWYSVISRPPSSSFTCVQRVSCCFSLLLCTMLTSIMFYGIPTDPSEQVMELGSFLLQYMY